jgi:GNAT superfamily N-acetyltransferase
MVEGIRHEVRRATAADRQDLARVLASAFADDPVFRYLIPPSVRRREARLRGMFAMEAARSARRGGTWVSADGCGAAVWFPPGKWESTRREDLLELPRWIVVLGRRGSVADRLRKAMEAHHRELPPHWYLLYLGTEPGRQSRGVGSALLSAVLAECDTGGTPAYLEASCARNRDLYLRHGFVEKEPLALPDGAPTMYPMWREPR